MFRGVSERRAALGLRAGQSRGGRGWSVPPAPPSYLTRVSAVSAVRAQNSSHQSSCFHGADILESEGTTSQQNEQDRSCHETEKYG